MPRSGDFQCKSAKDVRLLQLSVLIRVTGAPRLGRFDFRSSVLPSKSSGSGTRKPSRRAACFLRWRAEYG